MIMKRSLPSRGEILEAVSRILREDCEIESENFYEAMRIPEDLALDSVGLLTFAGQIENNFQIYLEESPDQPLKTLGEVIDLVELRLREGIVG